MKTIRQSTIAMIIALVSTAALGPGTFFPFGMDTVKQQNMPASALAAPAPNDFLAFLPPLENAGASELPALLLAMNTAEDETFAAIDFGKPFAHGPISGSGEHGVRSGWSAPAGMNAGRSEGYGGAGAGAPGLPGMQLARRGASASGVSTGMEEGSPEGGLSVIVLDDPAMVDRDIQQLPASFVSPTPAGLEGRGESADGADGSGTAVPEPATVLLLACGLLGLFMTRGRATKRRG